MISPEFLHYGSIALLILLGQIGGGFGLGFASTGMHDAFTRQPIATASCFRAMIIGLALIESGAIIALVVALISLFGTPENITLAWAMTECAANIAVGSAAFCVCIASSFVAHAVSRAIARQPFTDQKIITFMLIAQSIIEAPAIFSFVIALLLRTTLTPELTFELALQNLAIGLVMSIGCIGPSIGQSIYSHTAATTIGNNPNAYEKVFPFSVMNQAVIETPLMFCLVIALLMLYNTNTSTDPITIAIKFFVAACTIGLGSIATGISLGSVAAKGCQQIGLDVNNYYNILRITLLSVAFIESSIIYSLIIALLLTV
ncbi:MAG: hypothetical protein H6679_02230 [Epsilonproteobacteria bacterium]|nr:hypothetical protein [Campylobacterota bacterium]